MDLHKLADQNWLKYMFEVVFKLNNYVLSSFFCLVCNEIKHRNIDFNHISLKEYHGLFEDETRVYLNILKSYDDRLTTRLRGSIVDLFILHQGLLILRL